MLGWVVMWLWLALMSFWFTFLMILWIDFAWSVGISFIPFFIIGWLIGVSELVEK